MDKTKENKSYTEKLNTLTNGLFYYKPELLSTVCHSNMLWKIYEVHGSIQNLDTLQIILDNFQANPLTYHLYLQQGRHMEISQTLVMSNCIIAKEYTLPKSPYNREYYELLVTFLNGKVVFVNITAPFGHNFLRHYKIFSSTKELFVLKEQEILYIEASHNHAIWHCKNMIITTNDTLQQLEQRLSGSFVRIQRGYLINKHQIKHVRRCEVEMNNGDVLSIPCKKYVAIREILSK